MGCVRRRHRLVRLRKDVVTVTQQRRTSLKYDQEDKALAEEEEARKLVQDPINSMPGDDQARFRVLASEGINTAAAEVGR